MAHIPDGFLSAPVSATTLVAAGALAVYAARRVDLESDDRTAPTLGLAAAAMFAAQAVNFPVVGGTSGHLLGATLVAVILGPWAAYLVSTAVLVAQALLFGDGGLTALGANVLNIGGAGALLGYGIYRASQTLLGDGALARGAAAGAAAYPATVVTGALAGAELGVSGIAPTELALAAMSGVYAIIGIAESLITGSVVWSMARRGRLPTSSAPGLVGRPGGAVLLGGLGAIVLAAGLFSLVGTTAPDALERLALDLGLNDIAGALIASPLAGYRAWLPGAAGTALAVVLGIVSVFAGVTAIARATGGALAGRRAAGRA